MNLMYICILVFKKKIYNYIKSKYNQVIVATHSIELLSMPDYENVFQIDKNKKLQNYSKSINSVQSIINKMGGSQNISLMRLGRQNKCIFVEGFDKKIINSFLNILYPDKLSILSDLPIIELGGFENYHQALGASKLFYQESGGNFKCICILDKDYRLEKDIDKVQLQADRSHLILHVWQRKELESYLVNLEVIHSFIESKVNYENFCAELNEELDSFYFEIMDQYSNAIHNADKSLSIQTSNQKARDYIKEYWSSLEGKLKIINGKRLLSFVIDFVSKKYKSRITMKKIISRFKVKNVDSEIQQVIDLLIK